MVDLARRATRWVGRNAFSVTYDLDLWQKILKIFVSHSDDRLRNGGDITHWNFAETRFGDI